jgi:hypothetical protein
MFDGFSGYVTPTAEDWKGVLANGMVVVDTNVLLNLYRYNQGARETLLATLGKFDARLWVPHQVMEEFWRNRDSALEDPEKQLGQSVTALRAGLEKSFSDLRHWVNRVSLGREGAAELESILSDAMEAVIEKMGSVVTASGVEMERDTGQDKIVLALSELLDGKVGENLTADERAAAIIEGRRRIERQIPPGYEDRKKQARGDDTEVGDYLVWLQLMAEAKRRGQDVLFVTGDAKEDWWRMRNKIGLGPRNELSEELLETAGARLFMLKPERLLAYARDFLHVAVSEDSVQNVEMVEAQLGSDEEFVRLKGLAESHASAAIVAAWGLVELAMKRALPPERQSQPLSSLQLLELLTGLRIMSEKSARAARELQHVRNRVAHGDGSDLTPDSALAYVSTAKYIVDTLNFSSTFQAGAERYEEALREAFIFLDFAVHTARGTADRGYDLLVRSEGDEHVVAVVVAYSGVGVFKGYRLKEYLTRFSLPGESVLSLLVVTNAPLGGEVRKFNVGNQADRTSSSDGSHQVQVVQWTGPVDNQILVDAVDRLTRRD